MGTNYYIETNFCPKCGRSDQQYHIGKSSMGWYFSLHVDPSQNIHNLDDIIRLWKRRIIKDEYGRIISPKEMISIITKRGEPDDVFEKIPFGYKSWSEFHRLNHSEFGSNGLFRHKIDGSHCIGHGDETETYDYIVGKFS